jgi:large subunit ribosomal protein L24
MKQKFSPKWNSSVQPRKQRKYRANAPLHTRHKMVSANLGKLLRKKYNKKSIPLRKGDTVKVMRGKFRGKKGKISNVDLKKLRVSVENLQISKKDGTKINAYFSPSNLQIDELNLDDKKRMAVLENKKTKEKKQENAPEKTKNR